MGQKVGGGCYSVANSLQITQNSLQRVLHHHSVTLCHPSQQNPLRHQHLFLPKTPYLPSTKHNIKVTETHVPLNAETGPQGYMTFSIQQTYSTNIVVLRILSGFHKQLEGGPMSNVMAACPAEYRWHPLRNFVIPFLVPHHKLWLTVWFGLVDARVPCSNAANTGERKTWT